MGKIAKSSFWLLWPYLRSYRKLWIAGFVAVFFASLFRVITPKILGHAIDALSEKVTMNELLQYAGEILGLTILSALFTYFQRQTLIVASRMIERDFRNDFFAHLLSLDRPYYDKMPTGDLMARASNDMDSVRNMLGPAIMNMLSTAFTVILALAFMISLNPRLTLLAMLPMPVITVLVLVLGRKIHDRYTIIQETYSDITAQAQENFSGIRVVKSYVQEKAEIEEFSSINMDYIIKNMSMIKIWGMFFPAIALFSGIAVVMILWFGGKAVIAGTISLGSFVAFIAYLLMLIWPMAAIGWVVGLYQRGMASLTRIEEILNARPVVTDGHDILKKKIVGKIELRDLHFSYNSHEILKGMNVEIEPGMSVAIIGGTGSGKSTLVSLLMRAYPVPRGMIFIDDIDINDYSLDSIRSQVAPVMQETFLFSETILSNIVFGNREQSLESAMKSAMTAGLAAEIEEFPQKYDTILGERGMTLSGGQKQRAALARALATDPRILILDDAFSSVDTHTEEAILTNLKERLKGRTSLIISHRISTVKNADLILVISDGQFVERGRHNELLELGGLYAQLYERQLLKEELEEL